MFYSAELRFLQSILQKYRIRTLIIDPQKEMLIPIGHPLVPLQKIFPNYSGIIEKIFASAQSNVIYRMSDMLGCRYLFLVLPHSSPQSILLIGPYMDIELTHEQILEHAEQKGILPHHTRQMEHFYSTVPVFTNETLLLSPIETFAECIWGGSDNYHLLDVNHLLIEEQSDPSIFSFQEQHNPSEQDLSIIESRYEYEAQMMQAVSQGQAHKVELAFANFGQISFEQRTEPMRNLKNYSIIMNTLLRKAAQNGGVHPYYLDKLSTDFAIQIEAVASMDLLQKLMLEMPRAYCKLVQTHNTKKYSVPIQKTIFRIESDLSGDLSLKRLAEAQNISASYLSSLFKKETGSALTDYVNHKRVRFAQHLLKNTNLQIQTIAQHCGVADVNYFTKVFKKATGITPKDFRKATPRVK